jgi:hypothetical protein
VGPAWYGLDGTVLGAIAANGVINIIITKKREEHPRWPRQRRPQLRSERGGSGQDGWKSVRGGYRSNWDLSPRDAGTVQGDLQEGQDGQNMTAVIPQRTASRLPNGLT